MLKLYYLAQSLLYKAKDC